MPQSSTVRAFVLKRLAGLVLQWTQNLSLSNKPHREVDMGLLNTTREQCRSGRHSSQLSESLAPRQALTPNDTAMPVPAETCRQTPRAEENLRTKTNPGLPLAFSECLNQQPFFVFVWFGVLEVALDISSETRVI